MTISTIAPRPRYMSKPRLATSLLFLMNGFVMGSWAPKIPVFAERLGLSESGLGLMILTFGVGSMLAMPFTGVMIAKFGSAQVVKAVAAIFTPMLLLVSLAGTIPLAVLALFVFGGLMAAMDVAMNGNAVAVEKAEGRAIMSSCHAFWSLGGLTGAGLGGLLISVVGPLGHALAVTVIGAGMLAFAFPRILADAPEESVRRQKVRLPMTPLPWLIGIMALFSMIPEGAVLDWSAVYLRDELGITLFASGFGYAAFQLAMTIMRFAGDHVRDRFGPVNTVRFCSAASVAGLLCVGLAPNLAVVIIGFAITGAGISNLVPVAFSAAGNLPGLQPGIGLSVTTMLGYSGILAAPSLIGFIAEHIGFAPIFTGLSLLHVIVFFMAPLARYAERERES
ncbi:MFS transporter [Martelella mediterranea]|uniref:MFS transporter n=1 Tax=Martelella mediterranea TaxID=293089 RepID=UPI001E51FB3D|nr:MFS transporter [Martelella mediterranea]MCD1635522.1 MFS transporter [Martelella mediterranea]